MSHNWRWRPWRHFMQKVLPPGEWTRSVCPAPMQQCTCSYFTIVVLCCLRHVKPLYRPNDDDEQHSFFTVNEVTIICSNSGWTVAVIFSGKSPSVKRQAVNAIEWCLWVLTIAWLIDSVGHGTRPFLQQYFTPRALLGHPVIGHLTSSRCCSWTVSERYHGSDVVAFN